MVEGEPTVVDGSIVSVDGVLRFPLVTEDPTQQRINTQVVSVRINPSVPIVVVNVCKCFYFIVVLLTGI